MMRLLALLMIVSAAAGFIGCQQQEDDTPPPQKPTPTATPLPTPMPTPSPPPEPRSGDLGDGLTFEIEQTGEGDPVAKGDTVLLNLAITDDLGNPVWEGRFALKQGVGQAIPGLDKAVVGMKPGEKRIIQIPWQQGYGEFGDPDVGVAPQQDLQIEAELISITANQ